MKSRQPKTVLWFALLMGGSACASGEQTEDSASGALPGDGDGDGDVDSGAGDGDVGDGDVGDGDVGDGDVGDGDVGDGDTPVGDGDGDTGGGGGLTPVADCTADAPAEADDLVSDFEDGTVGVNPVEGRGGGFYVFNDLNDPEAQPFTVEPMNRCEDGSSLFSFCTSGSNFKIWGAGFGTDLGVLDPDTMKKPTVDLSAYKGISFWLAARPGSAAPTVKVMLPDVNTAGEGGKCSTDGAAEPAEQCDPFVKNVPVTAKWSQVQVLFADLKQGGWGKKVPAFSKDAVFGVQLQFGPSAKFDVCFDQLVLLR